MKTTIKILLLTFLLTSCSADEVEKNNCDCITTYYTIEPGVSAFQWYGVTPSPELSCDDAMKNKVSTGVGNMFYQVVCE
jgi:hypothetical protein